MQNPPGPTCTIGSRYAWSGCSLCHPMTKRSEVSGLKTPLFLAVRVRVVGPKKGVTSNIHWAMAPSFWHLTGYFKSAELLLSNRSSFLLG